MDSEEDSLFLLDEEVPEADSVAEDYKSRPIDRSFSDRNQRRPKWRSHERGARHHHHEDNHRNSMYGKSCPAAPIVGSLPAPSLLEGDIPDLVLPPNSHQEISHMLSAATGDSSEGEEVQSGGGAEHASATTAAAAVAVTGNEDTAARARPAARFLHFEQKRVRRKTRNVFSDMASSCPAQLHSNFMGGRLASSTTATTTATTFARTKEGTATSHAPLPPRAPQRQTRQTRHATGAHDQPHHHHRHEHHHGRERHSPERRGDLNSQQGTEDPDPDQAILSTSQTALSILQQHAQRQEQQEAQQSQRGSR